MNLEKILGSMVLSLVKTLVASGVESSAALRLASFIVIENAFGREVTLSLGISPATARRYRSQLRDLDLEIAEENQAELQNEVLQLLTGLEDLARDGRVQTHADEIAKIIEEKAAHDTH